jgi:hypothetical protein
MASEGRAFLQAIEKHRLTSVIVQDCGPVMNRVAEQVLSQLPVQFSFGGGSGSEQVLWLEPWDSQVSDSEGFWRTVEALRRLAFRVEDCCIGPRTSGPMLIQRSPLPSFYHSDGAAEIKGYGTSRRKIRNLRRISAFLALSGISHTYYVPGRHSIFCQIRKFSVSERVIGIRGAEWANAAWLPQSSRIKVIYPETKSNRLLETYLDSLGLDYELVRVPDAYPTVSFRAVKAFFSAQA